MREMQETQEYKELKGYLLGLAATDETRERVETRLMLEPEYYEDMLSVEEELVQHYVDDKLPPKEKQAFETHFLISEDRRNKVKFARNFRNYLDELADLEKPQPKERFSFAGLFSSPKLWVPVLASAVLLMLLFVFPWNWRTNNPDSGQELALLNKAHSEERTLQYRVTEMEYARFDDRKLRGPGEKPKVDEPALDLAKDLILKNVNKDPNVENRALAARFYLTNKEFDKAREQLEAAQKLAPDNAEIYNDLGITYLEEGQPEGDKGADFKLTEKALANFNQALDNFDHALRLKPDLQAALFNRALCLEAKSLVSKAEANPLVNQAKEAWNEYLKYDSTSPWADEARKHLEALTPSTSMTSDELQENFLNAVAANKKDEAFRLVSKNREMITQSYLPQKLAMSLLESEGDRKSEIYQGLRSLGELEKQNIDDHLASDLADFYQDLPPEKTGILRNAQAKMREGYAACLDNNDCKGAPQKFSDAQALFKEAGDVIEENTVAAYFIAYTLSLVNDERKEAVEIYKQVDKFSSERNYRWFALMNRDWLIGGQRDLGQLLPNDVKKRCQLGLKEAREIKDEFMIQKFLRALMQRGLSVKTRDEDTYSYLQEILEYSSGTDISYRQKGRGYDCAIRILNSARFGALSRAMARENIASIENSSADRRFVINAQKNAGDIYAENDDFAEAEKWLSEAKKTTEKMDEGAQRQEDLSEILLSWGNVKSNVNNKENKDFPQAIAYYNESLQIQTAMITPKPLLFYETRKSRLLAYEAQGNETEVERDLPEIIKLSEEKRKNIDSEQERISFFNYDQEVFDVGIAHEFRGNNTEKAFNYAETSSSRSLLDALQKDANRVSAPPLTLAEIRKQMPANVQLLQYAVLEDKVLIWIISQDNFDLVSSGVSRDDLKKKVDQYFNDIQSKNKSEDLSRELYGLLIAPALPYLDKNRVLCIVPNKMLFKLAFGALMSPEGNYFIKEFGFFYSPSANVFILSTQEARSRAGGKNEALLSVGNPAFDGRQLPDLKDLPDSAAEARAIAENYSNPKTKVLTNKDATKDAFRRFMVNADVIQFAGHYLVNPDFPLSSELVMAKSSDKEEDNFFTNAELQQEKLPRTKMVVLAACRTGVEGYNNGEGLIGLSRTFLARGVPLVVASQWPVDSAPTAQLMKNFHRYRKQNGLSAIKALRRAQLEMIDDARFRSPFYWASFAAFGGYAEF